MYDLGLINAIRAYLKDGIPPGDKFLKERYRSARYFLDRLYRRDALYNQDVTTGYVKAGNNKWTNKINQ